MDSIVGLHVNFAFKQCNSGTVQLTTCNNHFYLIRYLETEVYNEHLFIHHTIKQGCGLSSESKVVAYNFENKFLDLDPDDRIILSSVPCYKVYTYNFQNI